MRTIKLSLIKTISLWSERILAIICYLFIVLFVYAAVNKLLDVEKFRIQISQSPLLTSFAGLVAWVIPISEILIAVMISVPKLRLIALYGALSLMVMFTAYIIAILNFTDEVPCSCGGVLEKLGWTEHLIFNICFVVLAFTGILIHSKNTENHPTLAA